LPHSNFLEIIKPPIEGKPMTTKTNQTPDLPPLIQSILNDVHHDYYHYCSSLNSHLSAYRFLRSSDSSVQSKARLLGFLEASTCLFDFSSDLYQAVDTLTCQLLTINDVTELAPSLDDSVTVVHQEATISAILEYENSCCQLCGSTPDGEYEDTGLGCVCNVGD
jgi:hypothetical protein